MPTRKGQPVLHGHEGIMTSVAFSPDGKTVLISGNDNTAQLWETATGREILGPTDLPIDAGGHRHGVSIPPPLIRPELLSAVKADAEVLLRVFEKRAAMGTLAAG